MKETFKELIADFHATPLPTPCKRNIALPVLPEGVRKALVFLGMRRSGKTWTCYQIMHDLLAQGLDISKILYLNFEDDRVSEMQKENFQDILSAYFELYPSYLNRPDIYFFFDEIHEIDGWEKFIRRLLDTDKMHLYVTGSSSKMLSKEIASALRGRTIVQEIFPFNFREYLEKLKVKIPQALGTKSKSGMTHHLRNFLKWGGFPETIGTSAQLHRTLLQGYISSVIYRDIIDRYRVSNTQALKQLLFHCLRNSATIFSVIKMYHALRSMGYEVSKNTLYDYMSYFEDAYCSFSISKFDLSHRKSANSMKKIFAVDQGLITAVTMSSKFDLGSQLETAVFAYLRRQSNDVFYYRTQDDKEIDFVLLLPDQTFELFQVCLSLSDPNTRKREIDALLVAMRELKVTSSTIVTLEEDDELHVPEGKIYIVSVLKLFLHN